MTDTNHRRVLLEETWEKEGQPPYRLIVWAPEVDPVRGRDFICWFQIENLDDEPRHHMQVSAALAVADAIRVATDRLFRLGARPRNGT